MRRVIGRNRIDGAILDALEQSLDVIATSQRRTHFCICVVVRHCFVCKQSNDAASLRRLPIGRSSSPRALLRVHRSLKHARYEPLLRSVLLRHNHEPHATSSAAAGIPRNPRINDQRPSCITPPALNEGPDNDPLRSDQNPVRTPSRAASSKLSERDGHHPKPRRYPHSSSHPFPASSLPPLPFGDRADWKNVCELSRMALFNHETSHRWIVVYWIRVGHCADTRPSACHRRGRACGNCLLVLLSGLAQMRVKIDKAWRHDQSGRIEPSARPQVKVLDRSSTPTTRPSSTRRFLPALISCAGSITYPFTINNFIHLLIPASEFSFHSISGIATTGQKIKHSHSHRNTICYLIQNQGTTAVRNLPKRFRCHDSSDRDA